MCTPEGFNTRARCRAAGAVAALALCVVGVAGCDRTSGGSGSPTSSVTGRVPRPSSESVLPTIETTTWSATTSYTVPTRNPGPRPTTTDTPPGPTTTIEPTVPTTTDVTGDDVPPDEDVPVPDE